MVCFETLAVYILKIQVLNMKIPWFFYLFIFMRQVLIMEPWFTWNTQRSSCHCLLSAEVKLIIINVWATMASIAFLRQGLL